ncbi:hypothetical protein TNCV_2139291 [Trichonephila clavipes]|uniref:Mos1 transposase HTH domain-containing protein n=1 Tax=Trichonephila clavipes TaxID=2585209 RepID=A0A8X6V117_TRICX|nr:hypothetical protein TNCV_2139291 [Trichonephila clavipes]
MAVVSISREVSIKQLQIYARCQGDISHQKNSFAVFCLVHSVVSYRMLKMEVNKEKIRYILQFFFDKGENASQVAEIVNGVHGADTVTANSCNFGFVDSIQAFLMLKMHLAQAGPSSKMAIKSQK